MRNVKVDGRTCSFSIKTDSGLPNAIRRALMTDVSNVAPKSVHMRKNTSCQTDEFIAHRIGMIPFRRMANTEDDQMHLHVANREAFAMDMVGDNYMPSENIPVIKLAQGQEIDLDVEFTEGTAFCHAKFSHIGPVKYSVRNNVTYMSYQMITDAPPLDYLSAALKTLMKRVDDTAYFIETEYDNRKSSACASS